MDNKPLASSQTSIAAARIGGLAGAKLKGIEGLTVVHDVNRPTYA